jgi:hypothetical protein
MEGYMSTINYKGKVIELHPRAELIAHPMVISLWDAYKKLKEKNNKTPAEKRREMKLHAMALLMKDREDRQH